MESNCANTGWPKISLPKIMRLKINCIFDYVYMNLVPNLIMSSVSFSNIDFSDFTLHKTTD